MRRKKSKIPIKERSSAQEFEDQVKQYTHDDKKRANNPPVGLVTAETDHLNGKKNYEYDPHLDPQLQWAGKKEGTSFDVDVVSLHVHERIDPLTIIENAKKKEETAQLQLFHYFEQDTRPIREAIEFYKHKQNWSNRLIAGDSLIIMNSLLEKEGMSGKVQMIYIDPPYGIKYGSNFQPFVNKRDVKDGKDEDLTQEPETIKAFRDTWELGIHSYLAYLRDRLLLTRELLTESGSCFVQISDENVHLVRNLMDEVFGRKNFVVIVTFQKTGSASSTLIPPICDYLLWYAKEKQKVKYHQLYNERTLLESTYDYIESPDRKEIRRISEDEKAGLKPIPKEWKLFQSVSLQSPGISASDSEPFIFESKEYYPAHNRHWATSKEGLKRLVAVGRIIKSGDSLRYKMYMSDYPVFPLPNIWDDTMGAANIYVVQTAIKVIQRCLLMTTDPGDLVFDTTCGSGTTAYVAEQWGRRWITCDTSRVAIALARQRLMTALFDYYELAHPDEGVGSGFKYKTVPHVTLKSIANNEPPAQETLYDQPFVDNSKARVAGPFTVEAVPAPVVKPLTPSPQGGGGWGEGETADESIVRSGETLRQAEWRDELLKCGIRGKAGQRILFSRGEPLAGTRWLHAEAETKPNDLGADSVRESESPYGRPKRAVISFGPEHAPLEQRQVELAWEEARRLVPRPSLLIFAAFQFDPEAAKDINETDPGKTGMSFLKVQMNADLLTDDLKKKRASNESFWLIGQPDVCLEKIKDGKDKGKYRVEVLGFDYYNTKTGTVESGGTDKIAMWMLDTDYDGRSLFPRQVFFPMSGEKDGWSRLARNLKAEIDEELIEAYGGTVSLPFEIGDNKRAAVKIVDDRGIESLKIMEIE